MKDKFDVYFIIFFLNDESLQRKDEFVAEVGKVFVDTNEENETYLILKNFPKEILRNLVSKKFEGEVVAFETSSKYTDAMKNDEIPFMINENRPTKEKDYEQQQQLHSMASHIRRSRACICSNRCIVPDICNIRSNVRLA